MSELQPDKLDWDAYRIILAISREGSIKGAARSLNVSNSTVGRHLSRAEARLKTKLFDRLNNGMFLTDSGQTAVQFATRLEQNIDTMERQILGQDMGEGGIIRLSVPLGVLPFGLAGDIAEFSRMYPDIHVQILASDEPGNFLGRELDVVIRAQNNPTSGLWGLKLADVKWSFVAKRSFVERWQSEMAAYPASVRLPYIEFSLADPAADREQLLAKYPNSQRVVECATLDSVIAMVESGIGTGRLARFMLDYMTDVVTVAECDEDQSKLLWILTHPDFRRTRRIRLFMEFVSERFKERAAKDAAKPTEYALSGY